MAARKLEDDPFGHISQPEEDPFAEIGALSPAGREVGRQALDVVKQIPSAVVGAAESALTFPAQATGFLGGLVEKIPGLAPTPEQAADRAKLLELTEGARKPFTRYVPDPETRAGQLTRQGVETALTTAVSPFRGGLSVPRAAGVGATAGVTGEAARQATEGTAAEPYAQIGGTLIGGIGAARQAERAAAKAALPSIAETKTAGGAQYDAFRQSGFGIDAAAGPQFSGALKADLATRGLTERTVGDTWKVLDNIEAHPFTTPQKFHEAYQELGAVAAGAKNANERLAANIAQERLLGMLERMPPSFITGGDPAAGALLLQQANQNWAAAKRAENVSGRITKAEQVASGQYSGLGLENELRRRMGVLGLPPEATPGRPPSRGFTADERRAFEQFGEGTAGQNIRRYLTGALSGRGGFAAGGALGAGGIATYLGTGDPITGAAVGAGIPAIGTTLALLGNRSALSRARDLERMLLGRSELANRPGRIPQPSTGFPLTTLAPTLANLGEGG
jgi:hypothetical protein